MTIPVAKPLIGSEEAEAITQVLESGWVTQGSEVAAFEKEFAAYVGAKEAVAVSNCTVGLFLSLKECGVGAGDEVVVPSHSFVATANAVRHCGAIPVFVDIDPQTLNLDPKNVETAMGPKTKAILAVHQLGLPCDLAQLKRIADQRSVPLIEDAACAVGSEFQFEGAWRRVGNPVGKVACFSFHPRKLLTTGDGGMITTNDASIAKSLRLLRHQGMAVSDRERHDSKTVVFESYPVVGYNFRLTDIQAAMGRVQLKRLPELLKERADAVAYYRSQLEPKFTFAPGPASVRTNWQSLYVRLPRGAEQAQVMQGLLDQEIQTRRGVQCAHLEPAYPKGTWLCQARCDSACDHLRESERAQSEGVVLPLYPGLTRPVQDRVIAALRKACATPRGVGVPSNLPISQ